MLERYTNWLESLPIPLAIAQGDWFFPLIESTHVLALAVVFGSIAIVDLRLLNVALNSRSVGDLSREVLPWTWCAFALAAITGTLLFTSAATRYMNLFPFELKIVLLALAAVNMAIFHFGAFRQVDKWGVSGRTPLAARVAGGASMVIWTGVIVCGRVIGFL